MKRHQTDYHGSRSYEEDAPAVTQFSLLMAWLASLARHGMRSWLTFGARPSSTRIPDRNGKRGFSVLGADELRKSHANDADCPFPTKANDAHNPRDWRVFP